MLRDLFSLFPAYAGVILGHTVDIGFYPAFPRIRGGDPHTLTVEVSDGKLFPAHAGVILSPATR